MSYTVAVVGATGNVGREMLATLAQREFPVKTVFAVASDNSAGREISFGEDQTLKVYGLSTFDFAKHKVDIALFSAGGKISAEFAPRAAAAGTVVIDNSSYFRMDPDVPLVVPEVNPEALSGYEAKRIIANPNCSTIQMVCTLKPLNDVAAIRRVVVSTYQSVSGAGKAAMDELFDQTRRVFVNQALEKQVFPKEIAFNVIPQVDVFTDDGNTKEEHKMKNETRKIMGLDIPVAVTCVRVPVFIGHSESINVEFDDPISEEQARAALKKAKGVSLVDYRIEDGYVTPKEAAGEDAVFVSRLRRDDTVPHGLAYWCVSDNLRKGAALNAVQIAEALIHEYL